MINVHHSTIEKNGEKFIHGGDPRQKKILKKRTQRTRALPKQSTLMTPKLFGNFVLWTDERKCKQFLEQSDMVVVVCWCRDVLLHQGLDDLP